MKKVLSESSNNHGYLAAILKAEGALMALPEQPTVLCLKNWEPLFEKIEILKNEGVSLTDHLAATVRARAEKKAQLMAENRTGKGDKIK